MNRWAFLYHPARRDWRDVCALTGRGGSHRVWPSKQAVKIIRSSAEASEVTRPWRILNISKGFSRAWLRSVYPLGSASREARVPPGGTKDDSPPFQRWVGVKRGTRVPRGRHRMRLGPFIV